MRKTFGQHQWTAGPMCELLQLALLREDAAHKREDQITGVFDEDTQAALRSFQERMGVYADGRVTEETLCLLEPYMTGYRVLTAELGDTIEKLSELNKVEPAAIRLANSMANDCEQLTAGQKIVLPLAFDVVPLNIRFTSVLLSVCIEGLCARYPMIKQECIGKSVMGAPISLLSIGNGRRSVLYHGAHHANEWITCPLLMHFIEKYAQAYSVSGKIFDISALSLYSKTTLKMVPMVNPDGVDLVTGLIDNGIYFDHARELAENSPAVSFPAGWKANINGVDLNLQYPAGWEIAAATKKAQGVTSPGPRDFAGFEPLSEPESRALYDLTSAGDYALTLSYHTQGKVIYWKYLDFEPKNSYNTALKFAKVSGYEVEETPIASGYAGYKDWFISAFGRPGFTVEAGEGVSPLPLSQLQQIATDNFGILALGLDAEGET